MKGFLWRVVYAAVSVFMFWVILPLFLSAIHFTLPGDVLNLLRVAIACIAIVYVLFTKHEPPTPF